MHVRSSLVIAAIAGIGLCALSLGASAFSRAGMPVRCEAYVTTADVDSNFTVDCETADGVSFTAVPAGKYLFVTDIHLERRLTGQTQFSADVRAWSSTGFINRIYFNVDYATHPNGVMEHFQTPMLIVPPGGHLATYFSSGSGYRVQLSGILTDSLVGDPDMFKDGFESVARGLLEQLGRIYG